MAAPDRMSVRLAATPPQTDGRFAWMNRTEQEGRQEGRVTEYLLHCTVRRYGALLQERPHLRVIIAQDSAFPLSLSGFITAIIIKSAFCLLLACRARMTLKHYTLCGM